MNLHQLIVAGPLRIFFALLLAEHSLAQGRAFQWQFTGASFSELSQCQTYPLSVVNMTAPVAPPFYMIAYALDGTPITSSIGANASDLQWIVQHSINTQLVLEVVDSQGHSGGVNPLLYSVITSQSSSSAPSCVPNAPSSTSSSFKIGANINNTLNTCAPWVLTIEGGTKPYIVTLAALNTTTATNVTLGPDDVFTFINRAQPNTLLVASASDAAGRWADTSPFVRTKGSEDTDCGGLVSSSGKSQTNSSSSLVSLPSATTSSSVPTSPGSSKPDSHMMISIIIGCSVAGVLILLSLLGLFLLRRRKRGTASIGWRRESLDPRDLETSQVNPFVAGAYDTGAQHRLPLPQNSTQVSGSTSKDNSPIVTQVEQSHTAFERPRSETQTINLVHEHPPPYKAETP